jgi:protein SCO1/2
MILQRAKLVLCLAAALVMVAACGRIGGGGPGGGGSVSGQAQIGGPFHLVDQNGASRDQSMLKGKWSAVFFGYTFCPDVCPTTLQSLADAQARLGNKARDLQVVFITVDPARDTPAQLKTYLSSQAFPRGTIGLTGSPEKIAEAAKAYKVFYQKQGTGKDYEMSHSSGIYLMNPKGRFDRILTYDLGPAEMANQIGQAMAG